jgi:hypothetical protein
MWLTPVAGIYDGLLKNFQFAESSEVAESVHGSKLSDRWTSLLGYQRSDCCESDAQVCQRGRNRPQTIEEELEGAGGIMVRVIECADMGLKQEVKLLQCLSLD